MGNNVVQLFQKRRIVQNDAASKITAPSAGLATSKAGMNFNVISVNFKNDNCVQEASKRSISAWNELMKNLKELSSEL